MGGAGGGLCVSPVITNYELREGFDYTLHLTRYKSPCACVFLKAGQLAGACIQFFEYIGCVSIPSQISDADLFRSLAHPARLEILDFLRDGEHCVCEIMPALGYRQAYISQQMAVLREAGLVQERRAGARVYYRACEPAIYAVLDSARSLKTAPVVSSLDVSRKETVLLC